MKWNKIATAILILTILQTTLPTVSGVGILQEEDEDQVIPRENRELAYITVHNSTEMELEMYVDIYSMQPGENVSIFLPLRTAPQSISISDTTEKEFVHSHGIEDIKKLGRVQTRNIGHIPEAVEEHSGVFYGSLFIPAGFMVLDDMDKPYQYNYGRSREDPPVGISAEIVSISQGVSRENMISGMNLSSSNSAPSPSTSGNPVMMGPYSDSHFVRLNFTTRAPIPLDEFRNLTELFPLIMNNLTTFIQTNPTIDVRFWYNIGDFSYYIRDPEFRSINADFSDRARFLNMTLGIPNHEINTLRTSFNKLVAVVYGYGTAQGYAVSMKLPLDAGNVYYPLGNGRFNFMEEGTIAYDVVFQCEDSMSIDFT